jgi:hypothetical protein
VQQTQELPEVPRRKAAKTMTAGPATELFQWSLRNWKILEPATHRQQCRRLAAVALCWQVFLSLRRGTETFLSAFGFAMSFKDMYWCWAL